MSPRVLRFGVLFLLVALLSSCGSNDSRNNGAKDDDGDDGGSPPLATACTSPNQIIDIPDGNLRAQIRLAAQISYFQTDIKCRDIEALRVLSVNYYSPAIANLEGLQYAASLRKLELPNNLIVDVSPIASLSNLKHLDQRWTPVLVQDP